MEEYIGFGLVGLLAVSLIFGAKKFLTRKKDLYDYED